MQATAHDVLDKVQTTANAVYDKVNHFNIDKAKLDETTLVVVLTVAVAIVCTLGAAAACCCALRRCCCYIGTRPINAASETPGGQLTRARATIRRMGPQQGKPLGLSARRPARAKYTRKMDTEMGQAEQLDEELEEEVANDLEEEEEEEEERWYRGRSSVSDAPEGPVSTEDLLPNLSELTRISELLSSCSSLQDSSCAGSTAWPCTNGAKDSATEQWDGAPPVPPRHCELAKQTQDEARCSERWAL